MERNIKNFLKNFIIYTLTFCLIFVYTVPNIYAENNEKDSTENNSTSEIVGEQSVRCGSCLLENIDTDTVLYAQDNSEKIYPASVTKILTALVVLRHVEAGDFSLKDKFTASSTFNKDLTLSAAKAYIQTGEKISVKNLLYLLLLASDCDAANVLAESVSGSIDAFADEMNQVAQSLGCTGSNFINAHGLHNKNHYTTCDDLYLIAKAAYGYETFRKIISTVRYTVPATNKSGERAIHNTNYLIYGDSTKAYLYEYCTGGKTGSTYLAKRCLLSFAEKDGVTLCCVMMGCDWLINLDGSRDYLQFSESVRLYEWGFDNFHTITAEEAGTNAGSVYVNNSLEHTSVDVVTESEIDAFVPDDISENNLTFDVSLPDTVEAPVQAGDVLGTLTVSLDGQVYGTTNLIAASYVQELPKILQMIEKYTPVKKATSSSLIAIVAALIVILLALIIFVIRLLKKSKYKKHKKYK